MKRHVGVVKWFGGYNSITDQVNDYGFVQREDRPDVYVNRRDIACDEIDLIEGAVVSFEVQVRKGDDKEYALDLQTIAAENDPDVLKFCFEHSDSRFWKPVARKYIEYNRSSEQGLALVAKRIAGFQTPKERAAFIREVPHHVLDLPGAVGLRGDLSNEHLLLFFARKWVESPKEETEAEVLRLAGSPDTDWGEIPDDVLAIPLIWSKAPTSRRALYAATRLSTPQSVVEFADLLQQIPEGKRLQVLRLVEPVFFDHPALEVYLQDREKFIRLVKRGDVRALISFYQEHPDEHAEYFSLLPLEYQVLPEIIGSQPADVQLKTLVQSHQAGVPQEETIGDVLASKWQPYFLRIHINEGGQLRYPDPPLYTTKQFKRIVMSRRITDRELEWDIEKEHKRKYEANNYISLLGCLPADLLDNPAVLPFLAPVQQVIALWPELSAGTFTRWIELSREAKVLCIHRATKESVQLPEHLIQEQDSPVRYMLLLGSARGKLPAEKQSLFLQAHTLFMEYLNSIGYTASEPLLFPFITPPCQMHVIEACEAKPYTRKVYRRNERDINVPMEDSSVAWCPRIKGECHIYGLPRDPQDNFRGEGARLLPRIDFPWYEWSIVELLDTVGVVPELPRLDDPRLYATRALSGYINRINDIRRRLLCTKCGTFMKPDLRMAKNNAVYNATVFDCPNRCEGNTGVYLSHCWGCSAFIDSRVNRQRVEGFYLCLDCGSGPRGSMTFTQGEICPQCGKPGMLDLPERDPYSKKLRKRCTSADCKHIVELPPPAGRTGRYLASHADRGEP